MPVYGHVLDFVLEFHEAFDLHDGPPAERLSPLDAVLHDFRGQEDGSSTGVFQEVFSAYAEERMTGQLQIPLHHSMAAMLNELSPHLLTVDTSELNPIADHDRPDWKRAYAIIDLGTRYATASLLSIIKAQLSEPLEIPGEGEGLSHKYIFWGAGYPTTPMIICDEAPLPDNPLAPLRLLATVDRNTIESKIEKVCQ